MSTQGREINGLTAVCSWQPHPIPHGHTTRAPPRDRCARFSPGLLHGRPRAGRLRPPARRALGPPGCQGGQGRRRRTPAAALPGTARRPPARPHHGPPAPAVSPSTGLAAPSPWRLTAPRLGATRCVKPVEGVRRRRRAGSGASGGAITAEESAATAQTEPDARGERPQRARLGRVGLPPPETASVGIGTPR